MANINLFSKSNLKIEKDKLVFKKDKPNKKDLNYIKKIIKENFTPWTYFTWTEPSGNSWIFKINTPEIAYKYLTNFGTYYDWFEKLIVKRNWEISYETEKEDGEDFYTIITPISEKIKENKWRDEIISVLKTRYYILYSDDKWKKMLNEEIINICNEKAGNIDFEIQFEHQ